jgi:serine/threonine protein kinase
LYALEPLIGPPPEFLQSSENLWALWHAHVKSKLPTYDSRREFLDEHYGKYYDARIAKLGGTSFEQELMLRDLAVLDEIGGGGFGVVYEAEHVVLKDSRAVKKLDPIFADAGEEEKALRRFSREAQVLDGLSHPNIVRFFDAGMAGEYPFIVMEYVEGENLKKVVDAEGPLQADDVIEVMHQVAHALAVAHDSGVVHRDLKPTNLMWDGKRAVVLDFGAGQWLERQLSTRMTTTVIGTSGYIADELMENPKLISPAIDCFSLGVVFHYLLTGRIPNTGNPAYFLEQGGVEKDIQNIILSAMAPSTKRYQRGAELFEAIEKLGSA